MIRFESVEKRYPDSTSPALNNVTLDIERGEFVFLVGSSGSGKSTFLRLVFREDRPSSGKILVAGKDVARLPNWRVPNLRRSLGVVFQDFRLLPNKTVYENISFALQVLGKGHHVIAQTVPETIDLVGLSGKDKRLPHELSGGEQQRVAIARAMVNRPAILLADEPTGNLDPTTSIDIMRLLSRINEMHETTIVMATHDDDIVNQMRRRVVELQDGSVIRDEIGGGYGVMATGMAAADNAPRGGEVYLPPSMQESQSEVMAEAAHGVQHEEPRYPERTLRQPATHTQVSDVLSEKPEPHAGE